MDNATNTFGRFVTRTNPAVWMTGLWALSGFSVLAMETLWMRETALRVGSTAVASVLVIAVFFVSAALGNLLGGRLAAGYGRGSALGFYAMFELISAFTALVSLALYRLCWVSVSASQIMPWAPWVGAVLLAAVPSFFSGASFPCLAETVVPDAGRRTAEAGVPYGANLLGASLGVVAGGLGLPWLMGLSKAFAAAAALQAAGGVCAWLLSPRFKMARKRVLPPFPGHGTVTVNRSAWAGWAVLAVSGVLSLATQAFLVVWARQVLDGSVYTSCGVLMHFLMGLGVGGWAVALLRRRGCPAVRLLAVSSAAAAWGLALAAWLFPCPVAYGYALTASSPAGMLVQALGFCAPVLPLACFIGGVFPVAWELVGSPVASEGRTLGIAMATNKAGSAVGAAVGLFVLLPHAGLVHGTLVLAAGYLALAGFSCVGGRCRTAGMVVALAAGVAMIAVPIWRPSPALGVLTGERVLSARTGAYGPVTVLERKEDGSRQILLNSRQRLSGTRRALISQRCQSWLPLLLCRRTDRVFTVGMAAGISAAAALDFPIRELVSAELVPEVAEAARACFGPWNGGLFSDPRSRVVTGDGRAVLARETGKFDAVIGDLFYPSEEGTANLYSREFFALCRSKLAAGGVCCLWLPCDQHTAATAGVVVRTFAEAFPCAVMVRANFDPLQPVVGLVGSESPIPFGRQTLAVRLATPAGERLAQASALFRSADAARLAFMMDLRTAEPGFDAFGVTTDDRPLFAYLGPRRPLGKARLFGFPLLEWEGRRALRPVYPSCELGDESPESLRGAVRAGNSCYAAAAASVSLPGDVRAPGVRERQVAEYLRLASEQCPEAAAEIKAWAGNEQGGTEGRP